MEWLGDTTSEHGVRERDFTHPGAHAAVPIEEFDHSEAFLAKHLGPKQ